MSVSPPPVRRPDLPVEPERRAVFAGRDQLTTRSAMFKAAATALNTRKGHQQCRNVTSSVADPHVQPAHDHYHAAGQSHRAAGSSAMFTVTATGNPARLTSGT